MKLFQIVIIVVFGCGAMNKYLTSIKYKLHQLLDCIDLFHEYNSVEKFCENYDFAVSIRKLSRIEEQVLMNEISDIIGTKILYPKKRGIFSPFLLRCKLEKNEDKWDINSHELHLYGYQKDCQEFFCLIKIFEDVNKEYLRFLGAKTALISPVCGYDHYCGKFFIKKW